MRNVILGLGLVCWLAPVIRAQDTVLADSIQRLLHEGFRDQKIPIQQLQMVYDDAVVKLGGPRAELDYAYSVVLRKNFEAKEGQKFLEAATQSTEPVVILARELEIEAAIKKRKYQESLKLVVELAKHLGTVDSIPPHGPIANRSARWLGIVLAYMEGPLGVESVAEDARKVDAELEHLLGEKWWPAYQTGRLDVALIEQELSGKLDAVTLEVEKEKNEKLVTALAEEQDVQQRATELKEKVAEFQEVATDDLADIDSKIEVLEKQYIASLETETVMLQTNAGLRLEIQNLSRQLELANFRRTGDVNASRTNSFNSLFQQIQFRETELLLLNRDYAILLHNRQQLLNTASQMIAKRQAMTANYQNQANVAGTAMARLGRMQSIIDRAKQTATAEVAETSQVKSVVRRIRDFKSYSDRSLETERDLLLRSFERLQ